MRVGNHNIFTLVLIIVFFKTILFAQEKVVLENLEPTFEEETEMTTTDTTDETFKIKSKKKMLIQKKL